MNMPGYGDRATWGPVSGPNDPRYVGFSGDVYFEMTIEDDADVEVLGTVSNDEIELTEVLYQGVNVLPCLAYSTIKRIHDHYFWHSDAINKASEYDE